MTDTTLALFGQPVAASLSPAIHRAFARQLGVRIDYQLRDTAPGQLRGALADFRGAGGHGCNITLPLKQEAAALAQQLDPAAGRSGAVNTLLWDDAGKCHGYNTDGPGLVTVLQEEHWPLQSAKILILGAGGVVRGILPALLAAGAGSIQLHNRTGARARQLVDEFGDLGQLSLFDLNQPGPVPDLLINATALGHRGELPPLFDDWLQADGTLGDWLPATTALMDLNYAGAAAPLRQWAGQAGWRFADGLGMLVQQAALAWELWFGMRPDGAPVREQLTQSLRQAGNG